MAEKKKKKKKKRKSEREKRGETGLEQCGPHFNAIYKRGVSQLARLTYKMDKLRAGR